MFTRGALLTKILLPVSLVLLGVAVSGCSNAVGTDKTVSGGPSISAENSVLLDSLDRVLASSSIYFKAKEDRIKSLSRTLRNTLEPEKRYVVAENLYDEYSTYDPDSAMTYVDEAERLAQLLHRRELVVDMELNRSYLYSATGMLQEADQCLQKLELDSMTSEQALKYCERAMFLSTHRDLFLGGEYENTPYSSKMDSLLQEASDIASPSTPNYGWILGWASLKSGESARQAILELTEIVKAGDFSQRIDAMNGWILSKLYEKVGDRDNMLRYLILSAMADIRSGNKEVASLEQLSELLYDAGEIERANNYVTHCIAWANEYKNRLRLGQLGALQKKTMTALHSRLEEQSRKNMIYLVITVIALVVLGVAAVQILRQNRELRKQRRKVEDGNRKLGEANETLTSQVLELQAIREELNKANERLSHLYSEARRSAKELSDINDSKEEYIANIFSICSNYVFKLDEFRNRINRLLATGNFEQAVAIVKSPELSNDELRDLYATFDRIFLQIYPEFVNDFNSLLRPEERIVLRNPAKLTTELRIYALIRLGLTDSNQIARFLHCSVRTVYNNRMSTRKKATDSGEVFAERVRRLGRPSF